MKLERLKQGIKTKSGSSEEDNETETETESEIEVTFNTSAGSSKVDTSCGEQVALDHVTEVEGTRKGSATDKTENRESTGRDTDARKDKQAGKIKIMSRKRVNSETTPGPKDTVSPVRKRRRTQSETMISNVNAAESAETRKRTISDLTDCLRYSLRKSHLDEKAAQLILSDIEALHVTHTDQNIELLISSLSLITRLETLPKVRDRSSEILSKINGKPI